MKKYNRIIVSLGFLLMVGCGMVNKIPPFGFRQSDEAITASVNQAFINSKILGVTPVHVETHQGNVLLTGYVKTIRQSDTAADVAASVPGVKSVQNNLIVRK
jgi:hyperosmotically inducible protein